MVAFTPRVNCGVSAVYIQNHQQGFIQKMVEYKMAQNATEVEYDAIFHAVQYVMVQKRRERVRKVKIISDCKSVCDSLNAGRLIKGIQREDLEKLIFSIAMLKKEKNLKFQLKYLSRNHNLAHECCHSGLKKIQIVEKD